MEYDSFFKDEPNGVLICDNEDLGNGYHCEAWKYGDTSKKEAPPKKMSPIICPQCKTEVAHIQGCGSPGMGYPYRASYEFIFFAQGDRPIGFEGYDKVLIESMANEGEIILS